MTKFCLWLAVVSLVLIGSGIELSAITIALQSNWKRNGWLIPGALGLWLLCVWGCVECLIKIWG